VQRRNLWNRSNPAKRDSRRIRINAASRIMYGSLGRDMRIPV